MENCPNCGKVLSEEEKIIYKCTSCQQKLMLEYKQINNSNTKKILCKFLIGLFCTVAIICLLIYIWSNEEYIIAKGDVALEKVNSLQSNIWDLNPDIDTSELDKIVLKRSSCIVCMIISVIGTIICCIILYGEQNKRIVTKYQIDNQNTNFSTKSKLQELEHIYKNNLITEEEYNNKRKEIINKF